MRPPESSSPVNSCRPVNTLVDYDRSRAGSRDHIWRPRRQHFMTSVCPYARYYGKMSLTLLVGGSRRKGVPRSFQATFEIYSVHYTLSLHQDSLPWPAAAHEPCDSFMVYRIWRRLLLGLCRSSVGPARITAEQSAVRVRRQGRCGNEIYSITPRSPSKATRSWLGLWT